MISGVPLLLPTPSGVRSPTQRTPSSEGENNGPLAGVVGSDPTSGLVQVQPLTRCADLEVSHGCATCPVPPQGPLGPQHYRNVYKGALL